jgi:methyl-accepting chemotaxis protein
MPRPRLRAFPLLLPALILVPLAGALLVILSLRWYATDAGTAARERAGAAALTLGKGIENAVQRQAAATDSLSRSPVVWLFVKFQGERLTASNRAHAQTSLNEVDNYARLLADTTVYLASEKTRIVYQQGVAKESLTAADPRDTWYFGALKASSVVVSAEGRSLRTTARLLNGQAVIGAVSCVSSPDALAAAASAGGAGGDGLATALVDGNGDILWAAGDGTSTASSVFDLFPGAPRDAVSGLTAGLQPRELGQATLTVQGRPTRVALVRVAQSSWYVIAAAQPHASLPLARALLLAAVPLAALGLILLWLGLLAVRRIQAADTRFRRLEQDADAARLLVQNAREGSKNIHSAAAGMASRATALASEAAAALRSAAETSETLRAAEQSDAELRAGITGRLALLGELSEAAREAMVRARAAAAAAQGAADSQEGLSRVVTSGVTASRAVQRAAEGVTALADTADRLRLLALNAGLDAARGGSEGESLPRVAENLRVLADEAGSRARSLSGVLKDVAESLADISRAAQSAGEAASTAASSWRTLAAPGAGQTIEKVLARMDAAGLSAERVREQAALSDRGRSAVDGVGRIAARIAAISLEISGLAESATASASRTTRLADHPPTGTGEHGAS